MKPGVKTSEFWLGLLAILGTIAAPLLAKIGIVTTPVAFAATAAPIGAGLYALARAWVKVHLPNLALDFSKDFDRVLQRVSALEASVRANPALSAEQATLLAKLGTLVAPPVPPAPPVQGA